MSGAFVNPNALTGGAGYKSNQVYHDYLTKHSAFYRRHSAAGREIEEDRRRSSIDPTAAAQAAQAMDNINSDRRGSVTNASGGAAATISRKGSVAVASDATRKDSIVGLESTAGYKSQDGRRPSTSLAQDLMAKMKGSS